MLFADSKKYQPVEHLLNWNAEYLDGTDFPEYDLQSKEYQDFYKIKNENVSKFGLFGNVGKFFFYNSDGSFKLNGKTVTLEYHMNDGQVLHLTSNKNKKDIITYKQSYAILNTQKQGRQKTYIESFNFGYKTLYENGDLQIYLKPIISFPNTNNATATMQVKLTANKDLEGYLITKVRGVEVNRKHAPLEVNYSGVINWDIK